MHSSYKNKNSLQRMLAMCNVFAILSHIFFSAFLIPNAFSAPGESADISASTSVEVGVNSANEVQDTSATNSGAVVENSQENASESEKIEERNEENVDKNTQTSSGVTENDWEIQGGGAYQPQIFLIRVLLLLR